MKRFLTLLISFVFCLNFNAQNTLNVKTKTGSNVQYIFSEKPKVTFNDKVIKIATTKTTAEFPMIDVVDFTFSNTLSAIETVSVTDAEKSDIHIYTINGVLVQSCLNKNGKATFSTASLPSGSYIIKNGNSTYKIIKK